MTANWKNRTLFHHDNVAVLRGMNSIRKLAARVMPLLIVASLLGTASIAASGDGLGVSRGAIASVI